MSRIAFVSFVATLFFAAPLACAQTSQPTKPPTSVPTASAPAGGTKPTTSAPASAPAGAPQPGEGASLNLPPGQTDVPIIAQKIDDMRFAVVSLDGKGIRVPDDYRGKLVLVIFWATWCPHCREELKYWREVNEKYREHGVEIVGLLQDANHKDATEEKAAKFINDEKIPWPNVYVDATDLAVQFGAATIPTSFVVDGDTGKVLAGRGSLRKDRLPQTLVALAARKKLEVIQKQRAAAAADGAASSQPSSQATSRPASQPTTRPAAPPTAAPASRPTVLPPATPASSKPSTPPPTPSDPPAPKPLPPAAPPK